MSRRHPRKPKINDHGKQNTKPVEYTRDVVLGIFTRMLKAAHKDTSIVFIGELCVLEKVHRQRVSEWARTYKKDVQIADAIHDIETLLEARVAKGGLTGKYNAHMTKFHMINNHDWKDKSEVENKHKGLSIAGIFEAAQKRKEKGEEEDE